MVCRQKSARNPMPMNAVCAQFGSLASSDCPNALGVRQRCEFKKQPSATVTCVPKNAKGMQAKLVRRFCGLLGQSSPGVEPPCCLPAAATDLPS